MTDPAPSLKARAAGLALALAAGLAAVSAARAADFDAPPTPLAQVLPLAIGTAVFYACCAAVLGLLLAIAVSQRHRAWTLYTLLVLLGLIYIGLFEQNLTGIVWTGVNLSAATVLLMGFAMLSANFLVAADTIPPDHHWARLKPKLRMASVAIWGVWVLGQSVSLDLGFTLFSACGCLVAMAHFFPVSTFLKLRGGYDRIIRDLIWILLCLVLAGATVIVTDAFGSRSLTVTINRALIGSITIGFAVLFIRNIFVLKSDHELALREALEQARAQVRLGSDLLDARERHDAALEVARLRNLRLATASHDIRQPISSLRSMVATLTRGHPERMREHLHASLDYLDELAASYVDEGQRGEAEVGSETAAAGRITLGGGDERLQSTLIGDTLLRMFGGDATQRGLKLVVDVAPAELHTDALALMRVMSNLISNAITHARGGDVRVSGAALQDGYAFAVSNRGGATLAFDAWAKGEESPGSGLGLAIVRQQAGSAGLDVSVATTGDDATCITVLVPAHRRAGPRMVRPQSV